MLGLEHHLEKGGARSKGSAQTASSGSGQTTIVIVTDFACDVQSYRDDFEQLCFPRPKVCSCCQAVDTFIGHGYYPRKPLDQQRAYRIWIKRWLCKACRRTLSVLPSFLLRFRHYLLEVIQQVVVARFEGAASWNQVSRHCSHEGAPSERTIKQWCQSFADHASTWLAVVQQTLAQHDATLPLLDVLGEATEARHTAGGLLQAATHLLAWAKTRWAEVIRYGLNDRLRFLWLWGHAQGLGRLI